eukprot:5623872-Karenia_brevis.AAC.1
MNVGEGSRVEDEIGDAEAHAHAFSTEEYWVHESERFEEVPQFENDIDPDSSVVKTEACIRA